MVIEPEWDKPEFSATEVDRASSSRTEADNLSAVTSVLAVMTPVGSITAFALGMRAMTWACMGSFSTGTDFSRDISILGADTSRGSSGLASLP
jgi:hypothetical protein